jgi:hypothetical protein
MDRKESLFLTTESIPRSDNRHMELRATEEMG